MAGLRVYHVLTVDHLIFHLSYFHLRWSRRLPSRILRWIYRYQSAYFFIHPISWHCARYVTVCHQATSTCKAFELPTRIRIVWAAALQRICFNNTLFLPSFPIPDMSDLDLERAAMAPRRWIELCGTFQKQRSDNPSEMLHPRTTRIIKINMVKSIFIVPGGRYLVTAGYGLFVWDLSYVQVSTVDFKLVASIELEYDFGLFVVQATPDGKGLVILWSYRSVRSNLYNDYI